METLKKKLSIAKNCICEYVIVHSENCYPSEATAAKELKSYIEKTTGICLDIVFDNETPREKEIIIGKTNRETDYTIDREKYGTDGYVIMTRGKKLIIAGGEQRGTMYGVYDFLDKYLGWRFFTLTLEKCLGADEINIPEGLFDEKIPVLEYRELDFVCVRDKHIAVKLKLNGNYRKFGPEYGGELRWGGAIHSFAQYIECDERTQQPCISDPENIKTIIEKIGKKLEENPDIDLFEISQNDNQNFCRCERCTKIDEEEGNHAGTLIRLMNAISDAFKDKYPNLHFQTFAYQYTRTPPKLTKPRDNIVIKLCPLECCPSHPIYDTTCQANNSFKNDLEAWNKVCKKVYIWDYVTNYAYFVAPFPNFETQRQNIRYYVDNSVKGLYPEGNYISTSGEFAELRCYLLAKLMWDPYMTKEEYYNHMDEFLEGYYGKGWKNIRKFIDFTVKEASKSHCDIWSHPSTVIPFEIWEEHLDEMNNLWDNAEAAAKESNDQESLKNIKRSRLQYTLIKLTIEHKKRFTEGDVQSRKAYYYDNIEFYNELVRNNIGWREAGMIPPKVNFLNPPLDWANLHTYGLPEVDEY